MDSLTTFGSRSLRMAARSMDGWLRRRLSSLRWLARLAWVRTGPRLAEPDWDTVIEEVAGQLETLNCSTEQDFLNVGGKLMEFLSTARQISSDMEALTELVSGKHGQNVSQALTRMLERAREMDDQVLRSGQALASVRGLSSQVQSGFLKLEETVALFRALCTLIRIETSRLGGDGSDFGYLADQVKPLSESIGTTGRGVLDAAARLDRNVDSALHSGAEISTAQLQELHTLIARVAESLHSFEERREQGREASARQAEGHRAVCAGIEDLVSSIQFHDITRQQIEHVSEALRELRSTAGGRARAPSGLGPFLMLQCSQLSGSARAFAEAMERMDRNLEGIAARGGLMAEESATLLGFSEDERESFFLRMESCFTGILAAVGHCAAREAALCSTAAELDQTIAGMRQSVQQIRGVEIQIQRIAINASIRSAHIGASGDALNMLADAMHRVALDSSQNTEAAAALLDSMSEAVERISTGTAPQTASSTGTDPVVDEMRQAVLDLHSDSERSFGRMNDIALLNSRLRDAIQSLRDSLSVGPLFAQVVAQARAGLERIGAQAGAVSPENQGPAAAPDMAQFAARYTMQAERDVHESLTRAARAPDPVPVLAAAIATGAENLGDNVELF